MIRARNGLVAAGAAVLAACGPKAAETATAALPAGTVVLTATQQAGAKVTVGVTTQEQVTLPLAVPATVVTPDSVTVTLGSIVEGRVMEVRVLPGDDARAGQLLLKIHSHELATAQRDLAKADAELTVAKLALDRSEKLLASDAVAREEVERRRATFESAAAERSRASEMVAHLNPTSDDDVGIIAPRAGTVLAVYVKSGAAVTVGMPLVDIGDTRHLWLTGFAPENSATVLARGTKVRVSLSTAPGDTLVGQVVRMAGAVDSLRRAVEIRVALTNTPPGLRPGMFATLLLPAGAPAMRVVVPADAVQRTPTGEVVYVEESAGRYHVRAVTSQPLGDGRVAIEGVAAGVKIVMGGAYRVRSALENAGPVE
jgi:cobalt-zinc-cadmium efflux system membrane fusion protein